MTETRQDAASPEGAATQGAEAEPAGEPPALPEPAPEEREAAWKEERRALDEARARLDNLQRAAGQMAAQLAEFERDPLGFAAHLEKARAAAETIAGAKTPESAAEAGETLVRVTEAHSILDGELGWLNRNRDARNAALAAEREMAASLDPGLAQYAADRAAAETYSRGMAVRKDGMVALEDGDFEKAREKLGEARKLLVEALKTARASRADSLVERAKGCRKEQLWDQCLDAARGALAAVPGHEGALALATEAASNLVPSLNVEAALDGRSVNAAVACEGQAWGTTPLVKPVEAGGECELSLEYKAGGKRYVGSATVKAKAKGPTRVTVALRESTEPEPGEEREFNLGKGTKIKMVWCPSGSFRMGDTGSQHKVTLSKGFWLAKTELTQKQWRAVMGKNPSKFKGDDLPVECVSWDECQTFCRKTGMRFPTDAEWEYACRAGTTGEYGGTGRLHDMGWQGGEWWRNGSTHPVGQKRPNAWGLCDMHGNVWEWCADWHGYCPGTPETDPTGPDSGSSRIARGGAWNGSAQGCRSAYRNAYPPGIRGDNLGFRPARNGP